MTAPVITRRPARFDQVDVVRGAAIVLMFLDHVLALVQRLGGPEFVAVPRSTITRLAMPAFFACSGFLAAALDRATHRARVRSVGLLGACMSVLAMASGVTAPIDVLLLWAILAPLHLPIARQPLPVLAVCLLFVSSLGAWSPAGYYPWTLCAWLAVGSLVATHGGRIGWSSAGARAPFATVGEFLRRLGLRPLTAYVVHLVPIHAAALVLA